jgi:hypothetical protein
MAADSLFELCAGTLDWSVAISDGRISASGERSDLSGLFHELAGFFDQSGWKHRIAE